MIGLPVLADYLAIVLAIALLFAGWRMVRGPSFVDRFVALDMLTAIAVGFAAIGTIGTGRGAFLDLALGISLINFVATAAFAVFLERKRRKD
ncbi:monovalent cation/H+ antiporter complex subunit F [Sphingobium lignivorans]|uniref:Multicomponent Na+:H+ antiporter subunit F n=1 Tax=Sphingobium lignivorans TaxID=2735886 RepID=A0ABR6NED9_9SPHN|nr:monovalent cation/H+ antiporter complex subunit F [Sphingobium lignivorans]MBB5985431.1 multicomponent Na+:H+ antiporter subunit F [Sphingobium lignivorans]